MNTASADLGVRIPHGGEEGFLVFLKKRDHLVGVRNKDRFFCFSGPGTNEEIFSENIGINARAFLFLI